MDMSSEKASRHVRRESKLGGRSKSAADASKKTTDASKGTDDSSKSAADTSKKTTDASKGTNDSSKSAADTSKKTTDASKKTDDASKRTTDASKKTPDASRKMADAPKRTADTSKKAADLPTKSTDETSGHPPPNRSTGSSAHSAREVSAGGVVVHEGRVLVIVPTRRAADGSHVLGLPKGHLDAGETIVQAATREVREETGVIAEPTEELGEVRYWYVRDRRRVAKSVYFFLFRYRSGDPADHDDEVLEARWMDLVEAREELSYPGEREMVARALAIFEQDR
jgi:8-oxo-dGTP pyrophosphatase MutT (NUDIX family)